MQKLTHILSAAILILPVAACSSESDLPESDKVSETRMDDVDVIDGTISDDMVDVDSQASEDQVADTGDNEDAEDNAQSTEDEAE